MTFRRVSFLLGFVNLFFLCSQGVPVLPGSNTAAVDAEVLQHIHIIITVRVDAYPQTIPSPSSKSTGPLLTFFDLTTRFAAGQSRYELATNPLEEEVTIESFTAQLGVNEMTYVQVNHTFDQPLVLPARGTANSGLIPDVLFTQGALATLDIIPEGSLDLLDASAVIRTGSVAGEGGEPSSIEDLTQDGIPTSYDLNLG
ncbi:hypothetical protein V5O48_000559 [Marasmius crinis-equi]|uniref:Uncharacterized protein n=1 Tax=Marasmius crinis-equi TaxID=585013 RepID=A0ABR3G1B4_9AGAR